MDVNNKPLATLIHISDLHFCDKFTNVETRFKKLLAKLPFLRGTFAHSYQATRALSIRINQILKDRKDTGVPTGVVFTGDLTRGGFLKELQIGFNFLREAYLVGAGEPVGLKLGKDIQKIDFNSSPRLFYVPGNHDIWQRKDPQVFNTFPKLFPVPYPKEWILRTNSRPIHLYGLNSTYTTPSGQILARGGVALDDLDLFRIDTNYHSTEEWQKAIHIVFLHHPIIDPDPSIWDVTMKLDGCEDIAKILKRAGVDLVLSGHYHYEYHADSDAYQPNHVIAGSATQLFSDNRNFLLFDIFDDKIIMRDFVYDKGWCQFVYNEKNHHIFDIRKYESHHNVPGEDEFDIDNYFVR